MTYQVIVRGDKGTGETEVYTVEDASGFEVLDQTSEYMSIKMYKFPTELGGANPIVAAFSSVISVRRITPLC